MNRIAQLVEKLSKTVSDGVFWTVVSADGHEIEGRAPVRADLADVLSVVGAVSGEADVTVVVFRIAGITATAVWDWTAGGVVSTTASTSAGPVPVPEVFDRLVAVLDDGIERYVVDRGPRAEC